MSDKRKLFSEMDRTFKRIQEGMELFDQSWLLLQNADSQKAREKCEEEVNGHCKKLQRLRDQVRDWIQSRDVKDKQPLNKARRDVETRMEKLRDYERESKMKEYSRAGLAQDKIDPEQKNRAEARQWLSESISQLHCQIEQFESEVEAVNAGTSRKKLEKEKEEKIDFLEKGLFSHRTHLTKFEAMLRMLDNETLSAKTIFSLKDEFEFYMDQAADGQLPETDQDTMYFGIEFENEQGDVVSQTPDQTGDTSMTMTEGAGQGAGPDAVVPEHSPPPSTVTSPQVTSSTVTSSSVPLPSILPSSKTSKNVKLTSNNVKRAGPLPLQQDLHLPKASLSTRTNGGVGLATRRERSDREVDRQEGRNPRRSVRQEMSKKPLNGKDSRSPPKLLSSHTGVRSSNGGKLFSEVTNVKQSTKQNIPLRNGPSISHLSKTWNAWDDSEVREGEVAREWSPVPNVTSLHVTSQVGGTGTSRVDMRSGVEVAVNSASGEAAVTSRTEMRACVEVTANSANVEMRSCTEMAANSASGEMTSRASQTLDFSTSTVASQRGDGDGEGKEQLEEGRKESPCPSPSPVTTYRPFTELSGLEPNSTELIWKNPSAPVLDWPSSVGSSMTSETLTHISFLQPSGGGGGASGGDVIGWQSPTFGGVPRAEEFFVPQSPPFRTPPTAFSPLPHRSQSTSAFECDLHWKLSTEVLFYIFYHPADKLGRYYAAKDLEARNWSFYTRLSVWMQRMDFPRLQTVDFERGNFRYWDRDNWKEEKLTDFLVDYQFVKNPSEELIRQMNF